MRDDGFGDRLLVEAKDARMAPAAVLFWLTMLIQPLFDIVDHRVSPTWLAAAGLGCYLAVCLPTVWGAMIDRGPAWAHYAGLGVLVALNAGTYVAFGHHWTVVFTLTAMASSIVLPLLRAPFGFLAITALAAILAHITGFDDFWDAAVGPFLAGLVVFVLRRLFAAVRQLHELREQLAEAAVGRERLRFARDLHDLLGHTLSLIVVKAEIVQRLAERDPTATSEHAHDIVTIGRNALVEVREAVTGYRETTLAREVDNARAALCDAGVQAVVRHRGVAALPARTSQLLGWAVREGVTNVIRHSGARHCEIDVTGGDGGVELAITDDGRGMAGGGTGNGLAGLRERMAAAGGEVRAEDRVGGGFRLWVSLPAEQAAERSDTVRT